MSGEGEPTQRGSVGTASSGRRNWRPGAVWLLSLVCCTSLAAMGAVLKESGVLVVDKPEENIRTGPDGAKIGSLFKGARIEKIGQDGKWVRFRLEGWIWGPSLEGDGEGPEGTEDEAVSAPAKKSTTVTRKPRTALQINLDQIKNLVNEDYGLFYSIDHDKDLLELIVRFRVQKSISREALERRQVALQSRLHDMLREDVEFNSIRVETNRADGSGQVGIEIVVTDVKDLVEAERPADVREDQLRRWRDRSRISTDGGDHWSR